MRGREVSRSRTGDEAMKQLMKLIDWFGKGPDASRLAPEAEHLAADHPLMAAAAPPAEASSATVEAGD